MPNRQKKSRTANSELLAFLAENGQTVSAALRDLQADGPRVDWLPLKRQLPRLWVDGLIRSTTRESRRV